MSAHESPAAARAALVVLALLAAAAFGVWRTDRVRPFERPAWNPAAFERLSPGGSDAPTAREGAADAGDGTRDLPLWVVPVQPACETCVAGLAAACEARTRRHSPLRIVALVVDTPRRPSAGALARLHADALFWDRAQVWRHRWGHRTYGEALAFTPGGRFVSTIASGALVGALPAADLGVPPDDL